MASTTKRKFTAEILRCILLVLALFMLQEVSAQNDPCDSNKYLGRLHQRIVGYIIGADEYFISDFYLQKDWYKLPPGYTLATAPVPCGTFFNWWLNDTLPTSGYDFLTVCQNTYTDTCATTKQINVTLCADGYAYELAATDGDYEAYCIEGSGSVDRDAAPDISELKPTISSRIVEVDNPESQYPLNKLEFYCNLSIKNDSTYEEFLYDIEWNKHSGVSKLNSLLFIENVEYTNEEDFLERTKLTEDVLKNNGITKPGFTITCSVRARVSTFGNNSQLIDSEPKFNGIKILTSMPITVEQDMTKTIKFQLTMPFGCIKKGCTLQLHMVQTDEQSGNCLLSDLLQSALPEGGRPCGFLFKNNGDKAWFTVSAKLGSNLHYVTSRKYKLLFSTKSSVKDHQFFSSYSLPPIIVHLLTDQKILQNKQCYSVSDPHFRTFNGECFDQHSLGTFILYKHKTLPVEVQTKTTYCYDSSLRVRCNCGVTVRAGRDIFQINQCDQQNLPPRIVLCDDGVLYRKIKRTDNRYVIDLPHGTKVELHLKWNFINVHIYPSLVDVKQSEGLCGYFYGDKSNDFKRCDGSTKHFDGDSWRAFEGEDLFLRDNHVELTSWSENVSFCDCAHSGSSLLQNYTTCSTDITCTEDVGDDISQEICEFRHRRKKRDISGLYIDWYRDQTTAFKTKLSHNPNIAGFKTNVDKRSIQKRQTTYTNETALADCLNMMNTTLFRMCNNLSSLDIDGLIDNCVSDAMISNSMDWTMQHLESIEQTCLNYVKVMQPIPQELQDLLVVLPDINSTEYYNESYEYQPVPASNESSSFNMITTELYHEMLEIKCTNDCYGNGQCINGTCQCFEPFVNFDCSMNKHEAPIMKGIPDRGECDLQNRPCEVTSVFGLNIAEVDTLTCRITDFTIDRNNDIHFGESKDAPGQYESMYELYCPLTMYRRRRSVENNVQLDDVIAYGYETSFSNDGVAFSESDTIVIYDSMCVNCTEYGVDTLCEIKDGFCLNGGRCYAPGYLLGCYACSDNGDKWIPGPECPTEDDDDEVDDGGFKNWMIGIIFVCIAVVVAIVVTLLCKYGKSNINQKTKVGMSLTSINAVTHFEYPQHGEYGITPPKGTSNARQHLRRGMLEFKPSLLYDLPVMNDTSAEK